MGSLWGACYLFGVPQNPSRALLFISIMGMHYRGFGQCTVGKQAFVYTSVKSPSSYTHEVLVPSQPSPPGSPGDCAQLQESTVDPT